MGPHSGWLNLHFKKKGGKNEYKYIKKRCAPGIKLQMCTSSQYHIPICCFCLVFSQYRNMKWQHDLNKLNSDMWQVAVLHGFPSLLYSRILTTRWQLNISDHLQYVAYNEVTHFTGLISASKLHTLITPAASFFIRILWCTRHVGFCGNELHSRSRANVF